jgi:hypothetical protein
MTQLRVQTALGLGLEQVAGQAVPHGLYSSLIGHFMNDSG